MCYPGIFLKTRYGNKMIALVTCNFILVASSGSILWRSVMCCK